MKKHLVHIIVAIATCLVINMMYPYLTQNEVSADISGDVRDMMETSFNAPHGEMTAPYFQNSIPAPHVQFTTLKKVQTTTNNTVIPKRYPINFKFFGPKTSPQSLCCFASPNDFFVVMLRHLII
ncbi:MAG: hypothetical protein Q4F69_04620 [Bacteroidia bacterium]|nr:hypothetical protein [Bacteroidia bacterium]